MNVDAFVSTLPIMAYGMLGIFLIIAIIYGAVRLLNKLFANK